MRKHFVKIISKILSNNIKSNFKKIINKYNQLQND